MAVPYATLLFARWGRLWIGTSAKSFFLPLISIIDSDFPAQFLEPRGAYVALSLMLGRTVEKVGYGVRQA